MLQANENHGKNQRNNVGIAAQTPKGNMVMMRSDNNGGVQDH